MTPPTGHDGPHARVVAVKLDALFGSGTPQRVGSFRFLLDGQRWEWSDPVAEMHGYRPGEKTPTTELLLSHKHPDDLRHVTAIFEKMIDEGQPFSSKHRIIDTAGRVHHVIVVGDQLRENDRVVGTSGFYIDVSESLETVLQESLDEAVAELAASRAVIEQAKGVLMLVYGIPAERAFDILIWRSQETNTKLRTIAENLVTAVGDPAAAAVPPETFRTRFDRVLLTAHQFRSNTS
ncbi:PAS and ANTAR domain-containing protein [Rhodococcus sp. NCIMB 12038]|uniref:PAS and ANTAR domain-containing protein n=1 Tax=Rhodococcus sp. NCIMB 12038 TaxID=933800 RepID=UPI000B3C2EC8|nr:PAS and ANTAR domain-containing protein [Rhodococcus sp. NCIMB 12038]OUS89616.1 transcription antitermination regulator [Rhodococcus sp. NCIMB 12038]